MCQTGYYTSPPNRHFTRYSTKDVVHTTKDRTAVINDWRAHLVSTYHLTGQVGGTCIDAGPDADALLANWAKQRAGQQVEDVKVDWRE